MDPITALLLAVLAGNPDSHWCKSWEGTTKPRYGRCYDQEGGSDKNRPERPDRPDKPASE